MSPFAELFYCHRHAVITPQAIFSHERRLLRRMRSVLERTEGIRPFFGEAQSGVVSFVTERIDCEEAAQRLSELGIAVLAGLHCAPVAHTSGGTFTTGTVRLSPDAFSTCEEMEYTADTLARIMNNLSNL